MISVVIPIYNGIEFLEESLSSVFEQIYENWEVIIGINGHMPDSDVENLANKIKSQLMTKYKSKNRVDVIYYPTKGKSATLNAMMKDCTYDFIAMLDVDDAWMPDKLERQVPYLKDYDVVATNCEYFEDLKGTSSNPAGDISKEDFLKFNPIINCSAIIRKEHCHWDENINTGVEDYDMWLRLRYENRKIYNIPDVLCRHRVHKASFFNNRNHMYVDVLKMKWFRIMHT